MLSGESPSKSILTSANQPLTTDPRRNPEVSDTLRDVDKLKLAQSRTLDCPVDVLEVLLLPDAPVPGGCARCNGRICEGWAVRPPGYTLNRNSTTSPSRMM